MSKNKGTWQLSAALLACTVIGCGVVNVEHVATGTPRSAYSGTVQFVIVPPDAPPSLSEVAVIQVHATLNKAEVPLAKAALLARARALGCDTIANVRVDSSEEGLVMTGTCGVTKR